MEYTTLVESILSCNPLKEAVLELANRTKAINLIDPQWENILNDIPAHQLHKDKLVRYSKGKACVEDKAWVKNVIAQSEQYHVIVAGYFSILPPTETSRDYSFTSRNCEPLTEIGNAMKELPTNKLHDGAKFYVDPCNPMMCIMCKEYHTVKNIPITEYNWCVITSKIFDGRCVYNAFKSQLQRMFVSGKVLIGILQLQIYSRTTFGDSSYKIGGKVKEFIILQPSALMAERKLQFSSMPIIEDVKNPAIEYPTEEDE